MIELVVHLLKMIARALSQGVTRLQGGDKWHRKRVTILECYKAYAEEDWELILQGGTAGITENPVAHELENMLAVEGSNANPK